MDVVLKLKKAVDRAQARVAYLRQIEKRFGPPKPGRPKSKAYPPDWYLAATGREKSA